MRSLSKMRSEPNMYGNKSTGNKPFAPIKRSSITSSFKLSSSVKNMLTKELKSYGGCGDDASIQSMNPRRRFQRRGSKSASMFKNFSIDSLQVSESIFESARTKPMEEDEPSNAPNTLFIPQSMMQIPKTSGHSCMSGLGDSTNTFSFEPSEEFACDEL